MTPKNTKLRTLMIKDKDEKSSAVGIHIVYNIRNTLVNTPIFGFVCHAEYQKTSFGSVVYPSTKLRAIILAEPVLVEAW